MKTKGSKMEYKHRCPACGKSFWATTDWKYKTTSPVKYMCSYTCLSVYRRKQADKDRHELAKATRQSFNVTSSAWAGTNVKPGDVRTLEEWAQVACTDYYDFWSRRKEMGIPLEDCVAIGRMK